MDIIVHTLSSYPDMNNSIKMEVGIEDCLHIEFEYNKCKWVNIIINMLDATSPLASYVYGTNVFVLL